METLDALCKMMASISAVISIAVLISCFAIKNPAAKFRAVICLASSILMTYLAFTAVYNKELVLHSSAFLFCLANSLIFYYIYLYNLDFVKYENNELVKYARRLPTPPRKPSKVDWEMSTIEQILKSLGRIS